MITLYLEHSPVRPGPRARRPAGKRGERVEFCALSWDNCLEVYRGAIAETSSKGRVILTLDGRSERARVSLECCVAI